MTTNGTLPIPRWMDDADYYGLKAPERIEHIAAIKWRKRIRTKVMAASGDGSYSIIIKP